MPIRIGSQKGNVIQRRVAADQQAGRLSQPNISGQPGVTDPGLRQTSGQAARRHAKTGRCCTQSGMGAFGPLQNRDDAPDKPIGRHPRTWGQQVPEITGERLQRPASPGHRPVRQLDDEVTVEIHRTIHNRIGSEDQMRGPAPWNGPDPFNHKPGALQCTCDNAGQHRRSIGLSVGRPHPVWRENKACLALAHDKGRRASPFAIAQSGLQRHKSVPAPNKLRRSPGPNQKVADHIEPGGAAKRPGESEHGIAAASAIKRINDVQGTGPVVSHSGRPVEHVGKPQHGLAGVSAQPPVPISRIGFSKRPVDGIRAGHAVYLPVPTL